MKIETLFPVKKILSIYGLLWLVYVLFLGVLMPHTAWTFAQFQQDKALTNPLAWMLAFSVECVIAAFTHKFSEYLTVTKKRKGWGAAIGRWVNGYSLGLCMVLLISAIANLAYAVQFAGDLSVFAEWGISKGVYEFAFGAMLPFISLVFALVLSGMADTEADDDPALVAAKQQVIELRQALRESERAQKATEAERVKAVERFGTVADIAKMFLLDDKKQRIQEVYKRWPNLQHSAIAELTEASPSHVSEVIKGMSKN
jgi:hypothetical protein